MLKKIFCPVLVHANTGKTIAYPPSMILFPLPREMPLLNASVKPKKAAEMAAFTIASLSNRTRRKRARSLLPSTCEVDEGVVLLIHYDAIAVF